MRQNSRLRRCECQRLRARPVPAPASPMAPIEVAAHHRSAGLGWHHRAALGQTRFVQGHLRG
jgi:hypothetical protein